MAMNPLANSWAADALEEELRDLFIELFASMLEEQADEINVYGAPHLGSLDLIAKNINADQLSLLRDEDHKMRYLFKAWRHLNPERGLHFLRTYLQVLWGSNWQLNQMWQQKDQPYPLSLKQGNEVSETTHFLTSRLRLDLDIGDFVPDRIIQSLKTAIAARFVLQVRIAKFVVTEITPVTTVSRGVCVARLSGDMELPPNTTVGMGVIFSGAANVLYTETGI